MHSKAYLYSAFFLCVCTCSFPVFPFPLPVPILAPSPEHLNEDEQDCRVFAMQKMSFDHGMSARKKG